MNLASRPHRPVPRHTPLLAGALCTLLLAACGTGPGTDQDDPSTDDRAALTIGLTYTPNVQFAPFYVAEQQGYFEDAGVDVTLRHHGASEGLFTAAISGEEDLVVAGGDEMLQAVAEGADLVATATLYQAYPGVLIVPADSPITTVQDLPGHTVGVPGEFGETWFGLQVLLDSLGNESDQVQVETIGFTQVGALVSGEVDAVMGFVNNEPVALAQQGTPARAIGLHEEVPLVGISIIATGQSLQESPNEVHAITAAVLRAVADIVADPAIAVEAAGQYVPDLDTDDARTNALATMEATVPLYGRNDQIGAIDKERWAAMAEFMVEAGLISAEINVNGLLELP